MSRQIYLDTEYIPSNTSNRGLVSIGLVDDSGNEYYAVNADHDYAAVQAHTWLRENVWPSLPRTWTLAFDRAHPDVKPLDQIRAELAQFFAKDGTERAELYAWFGTQDHFRLLGLWGHDWEEMPRQIPTTIHELWHVVGAAGLKENLPEHDGDVHHALADAHYARTLHRHADLSTLPPTLPIEEAAELARYRTANARGTLFRFDGAQMRGEFFEGELVLMDRLLSSVTKAARQGNLEEVATLLKAHEEQAARALAEQQRRDCSHIPECTWERDDGQTESGPEVQAVVRPTCYEVCALPEHAPCAGHYTLTVAEWEHDRWTVSHFNELLGPDGTFAEASLDDLQDRSWMEERSWDRSVALSRAREAAPDVRVNSIPASAVLRRLMGANHPDQAPFSGSVRDDEVTEKGEGN
ncbi:3'-5' exoribonuclease [Streptomyces sp. B-S-A8]|uniref:3'-5' exoribonuclease n=1 Tax=Streptomyces solicavernae TaxID=3043614 RepID=A0ABT6S0E6_9ACTN|nr:3'-5' exoribonuclease [Streptomyces sp. B-S-A8]MDI3390156.1 3'-5' exoribonuclease [Streptomyces sp. B-S-A8]